MDSSPDTMYPYMNVMYTYKECLLWLYSDSKGFAFPQLSKNSLKSEFVIKKEKLKLEAASAVPTLLLFRALPSLLYSASPCSFLPRMDGVVGR